jgi:RsiW-degrading membrane proteinase PrsW (M82 family)
MGLLLVAAVPNPVALGLAAAAAVMPVPTFVLVVLSLDRYEREPWQVLLAAFLWGALVATLFSAIANDVSNAIISVFVGDAIGDFVTASFVAPVVEETAKGLALLVLLVVLRSEFDDLLDGIVYGSMVGIGFAMTENILYFGRIYQEDGLAGLGVLFYIRVILGGFGHALYTGTTGAALGYAREVRSTGVRLFVPPFGWLMAVIQHSAWNLIAGAIVPAALPDLNPLLLLLVVMPLFSFILSGPGLVSLIILATFAWRREARVIRLYLAEEVANGTLTPDEYAALPSQQARMRLELAAFRRGIGRWLAMRAFHQAATELAFRKWHVATGDRPRRAIRVTPEDRYRGMIAMHRRAALEA